MKDQELLAVVEFGGYPNFTPLYQRHGYRVEMVNSMRKAQAWLKKHTPVVVVTEFNFDPEFRDRMSNLESLMATLQKYSPDSRVVVFYDLKHQYRLDKLQQRYPLFGVCAFPVQESDVEALLEIL
ncbi:MAG: hypothetical protein DIZ78_04345 [endosymbiont of Escarpia spicata]|uniref:Uncharacterized protein n=1 Tax=endosymbiont of Escarpia spicata TaxID=2200908 RepID=A0A370DT98_9GAMM|nr:MAG: hypothetical protein DIZ78_04345 [endosymbiont of Escarpia spicata]